MPTAVVTYQNTDRECFCQLKLDSGQRLFISIGSGTLRISKLLGGFIPTKKLLEVPLDHDVLDVLFLPADIELEVEAVSLLDRVVQTLLPCRDLQEVTNRLDPYRQAPAAYAVCCKRAAIRFKKGTEALLQAVEAADHDKAQLQTIIDRCNQILAGEDVFTEDELRRLDQMSTSVTARLDEGLRQVEGMLQKVK